MINKYLVCYTCYGVREGERENQVYSPLAIFCRAESVEHGRYAAILRQVLGIPGTRQAFSRSTFPSFSKNDAALQRDGDAMAMQCEVDRKEAGSTTFFTTAQIAADTNTLIVRYLV